MSTVEVGLDGMPTTPPIPLSPPSDWLQGAVSTDGTIIVPSVAQNGTTGSILRFGPTSASPAATDSVTLSLPVVYAQSAASGTSALIGWCGAAPGNGHQFFLSSVPEIGPASAPVAFGALVADLNGGPYVTPAHGDFFVAWSDLHTSAYVQVASSEGRPRSQLFTTEHHQFVNGQVPVETSDGVLYVYNTLGTTGYGYDSYAIPFRCR